MAMTVGDFKKLLAVKRDTDYISINNMLIDFAKVDMENKVDSSTNLLVFSPGELTNENIRKSRLRAVGVMVK